MISYITIGADDIAQAKQFYSALLSDLNYELKENSEGISCSLADHIDPAGTLPALYIKPAFDRRPASAGNGTMIAFKASNQKQVRDLHAAALSAGGFDEGQPGFRDSYGPHFFVGYLRDPQGNKIALFSNNPSEPSRET